MIEFGIDVLKLFFYLGQATVCVRAYRGRQTGNIELPQGGFIAEIPFAHEKRRLQGHAEFFCSLF